MIIKERNDAQRSLENLDQRQEKWIDIASETFEFCRAAQTKFTNGTDHEKRLILACIGSNFVLKDGELTIEAKPIFQVIEKHAVGVSKRNIRFEPAQARFKKPQSEVCEGQNLKWLPLVNAFRTTHRLNVIRFKHEIKVLHEEFCELVH